MPARHSLIAAALVCVLPFTPARAADFVMKIGTATINETQHQFIKFYKEEVEKASGGRIEVQIYPASQLGPIPREIEGVQLGDIQGYVGPVDFFVGVDPRFGVFSAPMLFRDEANAAATIHDPAVQKAMFDLAAPKRMVGISTQLLGAADYGAKKPIMTLADFNGKKLRINGTELERQKMAKLGATGVGMPLSEVVPALDQGTIDGTISGLVGVRRLQDGRPPQGRDRDQRHFHHLDRRCSASRGSIRCRRTCRRSWSMPAPRFKAKTQQWEIDFTKQGRSDWAALGGTVHTISADEYAKMKTLLDPVGDEATKDQPAVHDMLQMVRAAAAKN